METVSENITKYFTLQEDRSQEEIEKSLRDKSPPSPIYSAKVQWSKLLISSAFDLALYGTSLFLTYTLSAKMIRAVSGKATPRPLPSYAWKGTLALFPLVVYRTVQVAVGSLLVHPGTFPFFKEVLRFYRADCDDMRTQLADRTFKPIRFSARSGLLHKIDALFLKNPDLKGKEGLKGRCILLSVGNAMFYESMVGNEKVYELAKKLNANVLLYNYAGVIGSSGLFPNQDAIVASHSVMCDFLEDLGAKEIVDFGWSIGGGVKWKDHGEKEREAKRYCSIDYKTFRSIKWFGEKIAGEWGAWGVSFLKWNYDNEAEIKRSNIGKIVVAKGSPARGVQSDNVIPAENSQGQVADPDSLIYSDSTHNTLLTGTEIDEISVKVEKHFAANV